jgi:hypothetical protein
VPAALKLARELAAQGKVGNAPAGQDDTPDKPDEPPAPQQLSLF